MPPFGPSYLQLPRILAALSTTETTDRSAYPYSYLIEDSQRLHIAEEFEPVSKCVLGEDVMGNVIGMVVAEGLDTAMQAFYIILREPRQLVAVGSGLEQ